MNIAVKPGKYVVAVSGGVDSVVLLDVLSRLPELELIVAHLDHGIREDSSVDAMFVMKLAEEYSLPFVGSSVRLGPDASEETARKHRYEFLKCVQKSFGADAIVTAHHQDDRIETAIINTLRGTGRKGLSSLRSRAALKRPLLYTGKREIIQYAKDNNLVWREDSSNQDTRYLRNKIRHNLAQNLDAKSRTEILALLEKMRRLNVELDTVEAELLMKNSSGDMVDRRWFASLSHAASLEILAYWLRNHGQAFDKKNIVRIANSIKVSRPGAKVDVSSGSYILVGKHQISLIRAK